jgi:hypothetical protein
MLYLRALRRAFPLQEKLPALQKDIHLFKRRLIFPLVFETAIQRTYNPGWVLIRNSEKNTKNRGFLCLAFFTVLYRFIIQLGKLVPFCDEERYMKNDECSTVVYTYMFGRTSTAIC